jgi:mannose-6-phosphate isomerase
MHRLDNASRAYDWGSRTDIPRFVGNEPGEFPLAEIWMGTHPLGASTVEGPDGSMSLAEVAGELPFMFKILAADRPLSLQVHPN